MRKYLSSFLAVLLTFMFLTPAAGALPNEVSVIIDGQKQVYDQPAIIQNGRTLVPVRGVFESLGATVDWEAETETVTGEKGNTNVKLQIGSNIAVVNGKNITLDVAANILNGRTLVPLRFVSEALGAKVGWDGSTYTATITSMEDMEAHFIDVGQGDSALIFTPNGKTILIDGGKQSADEKVVSYLKQAGVSSIDLMVATHPDSDHIGGLIAVLEQFEVKKVLDSGKSHTSQTYLEYLTIIDSKDIPFEVAKEGNLIDLDSDIQIKVLNSGSEIKDNNESSVVLKITYGQIDFLFTGDAENKQEAEMVSKHGVDAEILKVGHHGSNTSSSQEFINAVKPKVAILSYGEGNSYGHPYSDVVNRLKATGAEIYSTAVSGNIVVTTDGSIYSVDGQEMVVDQPEENDVSPIINPSTSLIDLVSVNLNTEIATIKNTGKVAIDMTGWKLVSVVGNQNYEFPKGYILKDGATVYITSGRNAKDEPSTYLKWTGSYIWNNDGDAAELYNNEGVKVDEIR